MKKNMTGMVAGLALMLGMATPMFAQYTGTMKVTVPFNFAVENERLQAGDYTIEQVANGRLRIHTSDGRVSTVFLALPTQRKVALEQAHFIFHRYGSDYFLAKIWTPGLDTGWEVLQGKLETEIAKNKTVRVETATLLGH